jgi:hypothetical protein
MVVCPPVDAAGVAISPCGATRVYHSSAIPCRQGKGNYLYITGMEEGGGARLLSKLRVVLVFCYVGWFFFFIFPNHQSYTRLPYVVQP